MLQKKIGRTSKGYTFDFRRDRAPVASDEDTAPSAPVTPATPEKAAEPAKPAAAEQPEG